MGYLLIRDGAPTERIEDATEALNALDAKGGVVVGIRPDGTRAEAIAFAAMSYAKACELARVTS